MTDAARPNVPGRRYDAALHLLDRQIVDPDGKPVAKVDEVALTERDGRLVVTALLTGPGALGPRLGGRLGSWVAAVWQRLRPEPGAEPSRIAFADVVWVDSAVHVGRRAAHLEVDGLERWLRDHLVGRIPGAGS